MISPLFQCLHHIRGSSRSLHAVCSKVTGVGKETGWFLPPETDEQHSAAFSFTVGDIYSDICVTRVEAEPDVQ